MYLHIGNKKNVRLGEVIGIFDIDSSTTTEAGKKFLSGMEKMGLTEYDDYDLPRSFVICDEKNTTRVRLSRLSSNLLAERFNDKNDIV